MTTYYTKALEAGGAGSGTLADPWNGLGNIDWGGTVVAGDIVDLQGQTYTDTRLFIDSGGSAGNHIVVRNGTLDHSAYTPGTSILLDANTHYVRFESLVVKGWGGGTTDSICYGLRATPDGGRGTQIVDCDFDGTGAGGTATNRAIQITVSGATDFDEMLVKNTDIHDCDWGIAFNRTPEGEAARPVNMVIKSNNFWAIPGRCIWVYMDDTDADASDIIAGRTAPGLVITDNVISLDTSTANPTAPINFRGSVDAVIARNYIKNAGTNGGSTTVNAINPGADVDIVIEDNTIINVFGSGAGDGNGIICDKFKIFTTDVDFENGTVRRNWIQGCNADAASGSLSIFAAKDSSFYSNVIVDGQIGIKNADNNNMTSGNLLRNNAVAGMDTQAIKFTLTAGTSTLNNNALHTTGNTCVFIEGGATNPTEDYNCFNGYSSDPMLDGATPLAIGSNSVDGDMKYKSIANNDLRLDGDSPCIEAGTKWWTGDLQGFDGLRFATYGDGSTDMGAYAFRPDRCGTPLKSTAIQARTFDAGVDIAKAKAA